MSATVTPVEAYVAYGQGAWLIDVREVNETGLGHAEGAHLIPRALLAAELQCLGVDKASNILLICQTGMRSSAAAQALSADGFSSVHSVTGGSIAWQAAGLPWGAVGTLSAAEQQRYSRQLLLPELGSHGQEKLKQAKVLLIGAGGLGSPAALYLAAAGIGTLAISDGDNVDLSNLHRQIVHRTDSIGITKTRSAAAQLQALNPLVHVLELPALNAANIDALLPEFDVVVDGSDNFPTRFLVADACVKHKKPLVYGAVLRFDGQLSVFLGPADASGTAPCYRCLFPAPPPPEHAPINVLRDPHCPNCAPGAVIKYEARAEYCEG